MEAYEDESSEARNALEDISMCIEALAGDIRDGMNGEDKIIEEWKGSEDMHTGFCDMNNGILRIRKGQWIKRI